MIIFIIFFYIFLNIKACIKTLIISNRKTITDQQILSQNNGIHCIQFDSTELMTGSGTNHEIGIWDLETFKLKSTLSGHTSAVTCLQFDDEKVFSFFKL